MIDLRPIQPLLKEDYISPHLEEEQRKREIEPLPKEADGMHWWERLWIFIVRALTKFLRKYG